MARFSASISCLFAGLLASIPVPAGATPKVYSNAVVFTGRSEGPDATWFVVDDGRVVDVGSGAPDARWGGAPKVDLAGRFVAPGFVDAHVHFIDGGFSLIQEDLAECRTEAEVAEGVARAARKSPEGWVIARNLGLEAVGGILPAHETMAAVAAPAGNRPLLVMLKGGHHAYANRAALRALSIDRDRANPPGGTIVRDKTGEATGLLIDAAAWDATRTVTSSLPPLEVVRAIKAAEHRALGYGITAMGDNTFFPAHMAQYVRMAEAGQLHVRVAARSYGAEPRTRLTMKSQGSTLFGPGPSVRYFGDKYFLDASLGTAGAHGEPRPDDTGPRFTTDELRDLMLFAGPFGTAFHTQSREGAERLAAARSGIAGRRQGALPDVLDHCGSCGGSGLPRRIKESGLRVTVLPGQLHDLPALLRELPPGRHASLLPIRELFDAGLAPALTSDWPFGAETTYPGLKDGFHRLGLAPLSSVAVVVSGRTPQGAPIEGSDGRTLSMGQALLGVTAYGALAIGRSDIGKLEPGAWADFVVLPVSPFEVDPVALYGVDPLQTYSAGELVSPSEPAPPETDLSRFSSRPSGRALSPIVGYDPVPGFLLGGAWFFYPYAENGQRGSVQAYASPSQLRGRAEAELVALGALGPGSPRIWLRGDTLRDRYYGVGMTTRPEVYEVTSPARLDASLGVLWSLSRNLELGTHAIGGYLSEGAHDAIDRLGERREGRIEGAFAGGRLDLAWDTRDNSFATRSGGRHALWTEIYGLQGGSVSFRQRIGVTLTRFIPLRAPDLVLALRAEGAVSLGEHAYATDFALGGSDVLRGYYGNRFRGDHYAAATAEVRVPLFGPLSGVVFGDLGKVWVDGMNNSGTGRSAGVGLRYGLPPDRLVRLRLDAAFAPDQWGIFFTFNEAF